MLLYCYPTFILILSCCMNEKLIQEDVEESARSCKHELIKALPTITMMALKEGIPLMKLMTFLFPSCRTSLKFPILNIFAFEVSSMPNLIASARTFVVCMF